MLTDTQELTILTSKQSNNALVTRISVGTIEGNFVTHTVYQDYSSSWITSYPKRTTSKVVESQHGLIVLDAVIREVCKHYGIDRMDVLL